MLANISKFVIIFLTLTFLLFQLSLACINVTKTVNSTAARVGDPLKVEIKINNDCDEEKTLTVREFFEGEIIYPREKIVNVSSGGIIAWAPPHLLWQNVNIEKGGQKILTYVFKVVETGLLTIQPTEVVDELGNMYYSNKLEIMVVCNLNGECEPKYGENYINCPQDCPSGSGDGVCDGIADGKCDPDCSPGTDPDCPFCGNGICEEGETYEDCPQDCPRPVVCGDNRCEGNETQENCCIDCGCPEGMKCVNNKCILERCGNWICEVEYGENYKTCQSDCPSGSADNYCDDVVDGICDPDCSPEEDLDCGKPVNLTLVYVIIGVVVGILVLFIIFRSRKA